MTNESKRDKALEQIINAYAQHNGETPLVVKARAALAALPSQDEGELRRALEPFAKLLTAWEEDGDTPPIHPRQKYIEMNVPVAALRRAREALSRSPEKP